MSKLKLKKLLAKSEEAEIVRKLIDSLNASVVISDLESVLMEVGDNCDSCSERFSVEIDDEVIGWVVGDKDVKLVAMLLNSMVNNENVKKELSKEVLDKYKELSIFYNITQKISASFDINDIARLAIDEARKYVQATVASVMLIDEDKRNFEIAAEYSCDQHSQNVINLENSIITDVINSGVADIVHNVKEDSRYKEGSVDINSMICSPIIARNKKIGVIVFGHEAVSAYTAEALKVFNAIAFQIAIAIENAKLYNVLEDTFFQTIKALAETIEMRDPYTGGHTQRVMNYSMIIGNALNLSKVELTNLRLAALMHDIGKIGISDNILLKKEGLSKEEFEIMKKHTIFSAEIVGNIKQLSHIIPAVRSHHERYDGKGYPDGLKGNDIPLLGRIIAIADSFDAMTSDRPYRNAINLEFAINELKNNVYTQFDPEIVKVFLNVLKKSKNFTGEEK